MGKDSAYNNNPCRRLSRVSKIPTSIHIYIYTYVRALTGPWATPMALHRYWYELHTTKKKTTTTVHGDMKIEREIETSTHTVVYNVHVRAHTPDQVFRRVRQTKTDSRIGLLRDCDVPAFPVLYTYDTIHVRRGREYIYW